METDFGTSIGGTSKNMDADTIKAEVQVNAAAIRDRAPCAYPRLPGCDIPRAQRPKRRRFADMRHDVDALCNHAVYQTTAMR